MDKEIIDLIDKYKDDTDLKKLSDKYYKNLPYNEPVKKREDMQRLTVGIDATLNYYEGLDCLSDADIEVMERRVAEYELSVFKLLEYLNTDKDNDCEYTLSDIKRLIDHISLYYEKLESIEKKDRALNSKIGYNF